MADTLKKMKIRDKCISLPFSAYSVGFKNLRFRDKFKRLLCIPWLLAGYFNADLQVKYSVLLLLSSANECCKGADTSTLHVHVVSSYSLGCLKSPRKARNRWGKRILPKFFLSIGRSATQNGNDKSHSQKFEVLRSIKQHEQPIGKKWSSLVRATVTAGVKV